MILSTPEDLHAAYQLRYRVFAENKQWIAPHPDRVDYDDYDAGSRMHGVFRHDHLAACIRATATPHPFMMDHEFRALGVQSIRTQSIELTRFAVNPDLRPLEKLSVTTQLFQEVYEWVVSHHYDRMYIVCEPSMLRLLQRRALPFLACHPPAPLPPAGVMSVCAVWELGPNPRPTL